MKLAIYGAGGLGREVLILALLIQKESQRWEDILFIDDIQPDRLIKGIPVLNFSEAAKQHIEVVIAVGEPALRAVMAEKVLSSGIELATLIHPDVALSEGTRIGAGCVLCHNTCITSDVVLGSNVFMQPNSSVGHDCYIGHHSVISTFVNIGGNCLIGDHVFIGLSAVVKQKVTIGNNAIISMSAAVFNDIQDYSIAVGNPARVVRKNEEERIFK